jgi:hypothetical protein
VSDGGLEEAVTGVRSRGAEKQEATTLGTEYAAKRWSPTSCKLAAKPGFSAKMGVVETSFRKLNEECIGSYARNEIDDPSPVKVSRNPLSGELINPLSSRGVMSWEKAGPAKHSKVRKVLNFMVFV